MKRGRLLVVLSTLFLAAGCLSETETEEAGSTSEGAVETPAPLAYDGPCGGKTCEAGTAGLAFVNSSGETRRVHVSDELVCVLKPGERCQTAIDAGQPIVIHVTGANDEETCRDPDGTFGECVCATFEIHC